MQEIKRLVKDMCYELDAAEHYAKHAMKNKEDHPELAETYAHVAREELNHMELFHAAAVRMIEESGKTAPEGMRTIWEYEHEKLIERKMEIQIKLGMYEGR